jgi:DHA1 family inner membrane transport protein
MFGKWRQPTRSDDRRSSFNALLVLVSLIILVDTIFYSVLTPLLPHYVHVDGFSKTEAGLLVGAYALGTLSGAIPTGFLLVRIGPKVTVICGLTLMVLSTLAFGHLHSVALLCAARFLQGLGGACTWSGGLAWLSATAPDAKRGEAIGIVYAAAGVGSMLGPVLGAVAVHVGIAWTFSGTATAGVVLIVGSVLIRPELAWIGTRTGAPKSFWEELRGPRLVQGMLLTAIASAGFGIYQVLGSLRLNAQGASPNVIAAAFLVAAVLQIASGPVSGRISDRRGRKVVVLTALALSIPGCLLLPAFSSTIPTAIVIALSLAVYGVLFVAATAVISDAAIRGEVSIGVAFALSNFAWASGVSIASAGGAGLAAATNDAVPLALLACAAAVAMAAFATSRVTVRTAGSDTGKLAR